jgi:phosphohistidine phosphatase
VKQLLILRHAKSDWGSSSLDDWERPLNERGERDAPRVGALLRERSMVPDLIVASDAVRARTTARLVAKAAGYSREVVLEPRLYAASPATILEVVSSLPEDAATSAMIVAHNPGLEDFVEQLAGEAQPMPTAALVQLEIPIDRWRDLDFQVGATVIDTWRPKD